MPKGIIVDPSAWPRIVDAVRRVEGLPRNTAKRTQRQLRIPPQTMLVEGVLNEDLAAPVDVNTPETATLSIYRIDAVGDFLDIVAEDVTVTNRDPDFSASTDDYLPVVFMQGEWRPLKAGGAGVGGDPDGSTDRVDTPGQTTYTVASGVWFVFVNTILTGGSVTITLPASNDGRLVRILNTGVLMMRTVAVTFQFTETSAGTLLLGPGQSVAVVYESGTAKWWGAS